MGNDALFCSSSDWVFHFPHTARRLPASLGGREGRRTEDERQIADDDLRSSQDGPTVLPRRYRGAPYVRSVIN